MTPGKTHGKNKTDESDEEIGIEINFMVDFLNVYHGVLDTLDLSNCNNGLLHDLTLAIQEFQRLFYALRLIHFDIIATHFSVHSSTLLNHFLKQKK